MPASNIFIFIPVLVFGVAILFFSHFFIYFSLTRWFHAVNQNYKTALAAALFVLPLSFILSSALAHWSDNFLTRALYFVSGLWLGILANLVVFSALGWLVLVLSAVIRYQIPQVVVGILVLVVSFSYSGYGVWNAYHPIVKNITVKIKNLPDAWRGRTAVQISDLHLGHVWGADFLKGMVEKINEAKPDIVFITGDLFDGMDGGLTRYVSPLNDIKSLRGSYFVTGNHETYLGVGKAYQALSGTNVIVLKDAMAVIDGLQIIGESYPERGLTRNLQEVINKNPGFDKNKPSILLYHDPVKIADAKKIGINLQLSGHTHRGQIFPFGLITRLIYGKYDYGLHQEGDFSIYTSSGVGTWGPTMRTFSRPEIVVIKFE